jgi:hypothetical protein
MSIDRSKSLIELVAKLRKLEEEQREGNWADRMNAGSRFCSELTNVAPKLLDALDFQPGDADVISNLLKEDCIFSKTKGILRRYQAMAARMEERK